MNSRRSWESRSVARVIGVLLVVSPMVAIPVAGPPVHAGTVAIGDSVEPLPVDPALTIGTLPNGLRYYIRVNHSPAHRAELRLVVNAGSVLEDEDQRGLAHFLEHMAFNGTAHFPKHSLIEYLETAGMRFGADLNAYTNFDETVYKFTVPTDQPTFLPQGLQMLADLAGGGITIDSGEVVAERGVIMGEWRSRLPDTASQRVSDHQDSVVYGGDSPYFTRRPIGLTSIIENAQPGPIKRFYRDWYRPELIAVVVVGDVDKGEVEKCIRERFGKIARSGRARERVTPTFQSDSNPLVDVYRGRVIPAITVLWKEQVHPIGSRTAFREQLVERLLFDGLSRRFLKMREQVHRPFLAAEMGRTALNGRTTDAELVRVVATPDSLESGVAAALGEVERIARYGVPAPVLDRQKAARLREFESAAAAEDAVPSARYASDYTEHYLRRDVALLSPAQELALARAVMPTITTQTLAQAARFWRRRSDLQILVTLPAFAHARPPTRESVLAVVDSVEHESLTADSGHVLADALLMRQLPTPGRIVAEQCDTTAGIVEWTLTNGARVILKRTRFNADEVLLKAVSPGGFSLVPDSLFFTSGRLVARMMTEAAGVGALDRDALTQKLATTVLRDFTVSITNNDESISLAGSPKDLTTLFQLLYLQFTAPKLDTAALSGWKQVGTNLTPSFDEQLDAILSRGDSRRAPPPWALIPFADISQAMAVYRDRFGNASNFTFLIVGNVTAQEVRPLVELYAASLPGTGQHEVPKSLDLQPWDAISRPTTRVFDIPKASTLLVFDGRFPSPAAQYPTERRRLAALAWLLRLKLTDDLREQMGGTYSVSVLDETYADPEEHYRVGVAFDAAPERMDTLHEALFKVLDTVRTRAATPAELARIAAIQRRTREVALQDNHAWLNTIELYERLKIPLDRIVVPPVTPLTAADLRAAAQHYLPATAYILFTALPRDTSYLSKDTLTHPPVNKSRSVDH